ncbi:lipid IV(A) 3-deoxy-D-manno-octulosonic acid transferase [Undibacterium sp. Jales W-56]|uniref:lipid IV(A) 3-deoxy-D-manno-octulosonic acid transferase n=1 Tax=Undibacterium sp. Jales W-56 TaxID=2897325 RepID=UPI0021D20D6D|nr:lipid IV(A) 3-deoxy-D-manno-octulosonic acid transferase [Undibacterium sp. Jales W-56]MCU6434608.1 lipid IV(A) 3-deoxy-D-manno-octulosonic acid transferase [Undibacterium sp. Jales W-56]
MRLLYTFVWILSLPVVLLRLWMRGRQEPGYRQHISERLGFYPAYPQQKTLWVHAVSAGETRAAEPLIRALLARYPQQHLILSHMTPTGRTTGALLFADVSGRITQVFVPYDITWMIKRFLRHFSPSVCVLIETEVWPNLVAQCQHFAVPVALVNARLSEKSLKKALKLSSLILPAAQAITCVAAQSGPDAARLQSLGVHTLEITGNMKFDVTPPEHMAERGARLRHWLGDRQIFLCASTRDGEEELLLNAFVANRKANTLLVITPRHPQRFEQVAAMLAQHQLSFVRRSAMDLDAGENPLPASVDVVLGDSMGEMYMYYAACDLAFVGGSLVNLGGHNLIEACAMAKPVMTGPYTFNFSEITEQAIAAQAALRIANPDQLFQQAWSLLDEQATLRNMGQNAHSFFLQHQGATSRTMNMLEDVIRIG